MLYEIILSHIPDGRFCVISRIKCVGSFYCWENCYANNIFVSLYVTNYLFLSWNRFILNIIPYIDQNLPFSQTCCIYFYTIKLWATSGSLILKSRPTVQTPNHDDHFNTGTMEIGPGAAFQPFRNPFLQTHLVLILYWQGNMLEQFRGYQFSFSP